jgi:hypothetical protein
VTVQVGQNRRIIVLPYSTQPYKNATSKLTACCPPRYALTDPCTKKTFPMNRDNNVIRARTMTPTQEQLLISTSTNQLADHRCILFWGKKRKQCANIMPNNRCCFCKSPTLSRNANYLNDNLRQVNRIGNHNAAKMVAINFP